MNPSTVVNDRFMSPPANPGVRPAGMSPFNSAQNVGPVRMEYRPNGPYQQQNVQHYITQQNHPRFPQPNIRFSNEDLIKQQTAPPYNNSIQNAPRGPVIANPQNIQMAQQPRFPGMQQPVRVPFNPNGRILTNQPNLQNYPRMGVPKPPNDLIQENTQSAPYRENYKPQMPGEGPGMLSRKPSEPKISNVNQKINENQPQTGSQLDNMSNSAEGEKKSNSPNVQAPIPTAAESVPSENKSTDKGIDLESSNKVVNASAKNKENSQKDNNKSIKDTNITSGMVKKNIKYFEEHDTSKTPLKPEMPVIKKREKATVVPPDVIKSDTNKDDYESGVDETPVVHPNLGSIFQVPRKVAKIPHVKASKRGFRKVKSRQHPEKSSRQSQIYRGPTISEFLKPGKSYLPFKLGSRKAQKNRNYGSKEELLAFFENTKSWKEMKRYGSTADQSTAKEAKLVHKPTTNGDVPTPKKTPSKLQTPSKRNPPVSPTKTPLKSPGTPLTPGTPGTKSLPKTPDSPAPSTPLIKKVPMNKIHVGAAPSPNLKTVKSKIGSLANTTHKPGGGNVKIESHKIDLSRVQPRTEAKNDQYKPSGGDKKIQQVKLQWSAKSKVGSLENATYKPSGGDKKIETVKLDFKEKAKPKVGSKDNVKHVPGGGNVKIESQKLEFKAQSKVGSLDNVKHKPGGGDIKIFDDKTYLRQVSGASSEGRASGTQAYSDLSIIREVEGRSAPGTPGRKTSVKLKKTTTIQSSEENPKVKNITEVIVTSQTPKKERLLEKSPTKQQVKVTYSKVTTAKNKDTEATVGIIKLPANTDAPILKPSLGRKDVFESYETEKQAKNRENETDFSKAYTSMRNTGNQSGSPNLPEGKSNLRDESGLSKFLKDEIATQEKVGQMWAEQNSTYSTSSAYNNREFGEQKEPIQTSLLANYGSNSSQQFRSQNPEIKSDTQINLNDSLRLNFFSNQNL